MTTFNNAADLSVGIENYLAPLVKKVTTQGNLSDLAAGEYYMDPSLSGRQQWMVGKAEGKVKKGNDKAVLKFISQDAANRYLEIARALFEGYKLAAKLESDQARLADAEAEYSEAKRYGEDFPMRKLDVIGNQVVAAERALQDWHQRHANSKWD